MAIEHIAASHVIEEALACWQFFRQMGYPAEEIFFVAGQPGEELGPGVDVIVELKHRGNCAAIRSGIICNESRADVVSAWQLASQRYKALTSDGRMEMFNRSRVRADVPNVIFKMLMQGLPVQIEEKNAEV